jgi:hypothetical protein
MQPVNATLKLDDKGNQVVNLQQALQFLYAQGVFIAFNPPNSPTAEELNALIKKLGGEQKQQVFGDATRLLIRYFQIQQSLGDNLFGVVEDKTAQRINELLSELGAPTETIYVVTGIITNSKTHTELANLVVRAFDADGAICTFLGQAQTDINGRYHIDFNLSAFKNTAAERGGPDLIIEVLNEAGDVSFGKSIRHNNCQQEATIDLAVTIPDLRVFGAVINSNKQAQANIIVTAWDRDLRKRQLLGSATTDDKGNYSIDYSIDRFTAADVVGRNKPWLIIEAQRKSKGKIEHSVSIKPDQVERFQRVDLILEPAEEQTLSEWEQVTHVASPLLIGQDDDDNNLQPCELNDDDIQFIVAETGLEYNNLRSWSRAHTMQRTALALLGEGYPLEVTLVTKLGGPLFYGLIRQFSGSVLQHFFSRSADNIARALNNAVAQRQIPFVEKNEMTAFAAVLALLHQLQKISPQAANDHPIVIIASLLDINLSTNIKLVALALIEQQGTSNPDIFLSLHKDFPDDFKSIDRFIQGMRLHQLTHGNTTLINTLANHISNDGDSIVSLAGLDVGDWKSIATESRVDTSAAMVMLNTLELAHPVEALQLRIESKKLADLSEDINVGIKQLLKDDPKKVQDYVQGRARVLNAIEDATEKTLNSIGLFARLSLPYEVGAMLVAANIDTPQLIIHHGRETIRGLLEDKYGEVIATYFSDATVKIINDMKVVGTGVIQGTIQYQYVPPGWYIKPDTPAQEVRENIPSIPALLGDLDECICPPCESMLGQPAYLVDLLQLLSKPNANNQSALSFLRARRPDIFELRLGCEQANIQVQHIDLVVEMFENQLRPRQYPNPYIGIDALYKQQAHQPYPWFMPFDKNHAQESAYLNKLNINARELNELTHHNLTAGQIAASVLGIPFPTSSNPIATEWRLLTEVSHGVGLWTLYGFAVGAQGQVSLVDPASGEILTNQLVDQIARRISVLLDRTGLTLHVFEEVIGESYVGNLSIDNRTQCKTSQMTLNTGAQPLEVCLDRIHRMVRLQRKLKWSFTDINSALMLSTQGMNLSDTIIHIAQIKSLADTYHLPINLLCQLPQTYEAILGILGISRAERLCLEKILGVDAAQSPISVADLKAILTFNTLVDGINFSVEELGLALLSRSDLQSIFAKFPTYVKNDTEIAAAADQLVSALKQEQALQQDPPQPLSFPPLDDESIVTLIATSLDISEQDAERYAAFRISTNGMLIDILRTPNAITSTDTIEIWLNCVFRLEGIRSKFDSAILDALIKAFDWITVIASSSATGHSAIVSLINWLWLAQPGRMGPLAIAEIVKLSDFNNPTKFNDVIDIFSKRFEMDASRVSGLALLVGLSQNTFNSFKDAVLVKRFFALLGFAKQWQADSTTMTNLGGNSVELTVESLLRIKYGYTNDEWVEVKRQIENPIRQQKRNALVAELIRRNPQLKNANDIYEYYLIDPLVEPCMKTTRILETITATQLFAQRVLFGVEKYLGNSNSEYSLLASEELKSQWTWMRNYRVWEANRKVFLFPENWLYPELRDDKSSSFKLLEAELGKGELSQEIVSDAFSSFLDDVTQMAQIQVLGMYEDVTRNTSGNLTKRDLYIVGRSLNPPYSYFWKKCIDFGSEFMEWSPWRLIELEIEGDHIIPFVLNGTLNIAWLSMSKTSDSAGSLKKIELKIVKSKYRMGIWNKPTISRDPFVLLPAPFRDDRNGYVLRVRVDKNNNVDTATVSCYVASSNLQTTGPSQTCLSVDGELTILPEQRPRDATISIHIADPDSHPESHSAIQNWPAEFGTPGRSAQRYLTWECWIKLKAGAGFGWMQLNSSNAVGHRVEIRSINSSFKVIGLGGYHTWIDLGESSFSAAAKNIGAYGRVEVSTWIAYAEFHGATNVISLQTNSINCARVDTGRSRKDHLIFTIDASAYTAEDLGLYYSGLITFKESAKFLIDDISGFSVEAGSNRLLFSPPDTAPFMNGYLESLSATNTHSLFLESFHADGEFLGTDVFISSGIGRYFTIEANSNRQIWESASVWHFCENNSSAFIDFAPRRNPGAKEFRLLPHSFTEAQSTLIDWEQGNQLDSGLQQIALFGADKLPTVGPLLLNDTMSITALNILDVQKQEKLTFDSRLPYAIYQWEIFFHAPLLIADQLSKQHQFEEAERWLRYVFDPASTESGTDATRFLKFKVFKELNTHTQVIDDLNAIAQTASGFYTEADQDKINRIIGRWRQLPFRPFVIARDRHIAFLWRTLFAYIDNLITWADSLYRRDTRESNNEAMMLYVLAYRILGRRPKQMANTSKKAANTYDELAGKLDTFSNYWVDVATRADGYSIRTGGHKLTLIDKQPSTSAGTLLFCMPHNDKLDRYWDVIEERLFNLRHCRNIEGIARDLPFFDSPIDPELLVRATAAGLDLGSVIAGLYAAPPHYRYGVFAGRAMELVAETKSLGAAMLSALEKCDAEQMVQLRSTNEIALLQQIGELKKLQIKEAEANITALRASRKSAETRYSQYQRLLGLEGIAPDEGTAVGEVALLGQLDKGNSSPRSALGLISEEGQQYVGIEGANTWSIAANIAKFAGGGAQLTASVLAALPSDKLTNAATVTKLFGDSASQIGDAFSFVSQGWRTYAEQQGMLAGHLRRRDDWAFQNNQVLKELKQIDKQILANQIRIDITKKELDNHQLQLEQSHAVDEVLRSKFTNVQLYQWMSTELNSLYSKAYRMALEIARKAQSAAELELGLKKGSLDVIRNDHWSSMKQGLLAGERLYQDLKRLDIAYLDQNKREFELTKHISLRRLNPAALVKLKFGEEEGNKLVNRCEFDIPEWLFDLDTPGHYLRRIKSVALSIPCVVGPYTSVNCKLTLVNSSIRHDRSNNDYTYYSGTSETVVTSTANADSGLFETQLHDERFLPFEHAGVISTWRIELPDQYAQFDYSTISDVILTIRYTARDGGETLRSSARYSIEELLVPSRTDIPTQSLKFPLLFSSRSDFPVEWAKAKSSNEILKIKLTKDLLPYWFDAANIKIIKKISVAEVKNKIAPIFIENAESLVIGDTFDTKITLADATLQDVFVLMELGKNSE